MCVQYMYFVPMVLKKWKAYSGGRFIEERVSM